MGYKPNAPQFHLVLNGDCVLFEVASVKQALFESCWTNGKMPRFATN